ncbi:MAG: FAD:protein FMN transferase [Anaerolineae bacterium]|nr:FAD:protein FMN transferase [Anaerolineae bacterium]
MNEILFRAMGSEIYCAVDSTHPCTVRRLERIPAMFEAWEKILSRFRPDSELMQLNARVGQPVQVSETLGRVLLTAQRAQVWSDGLVTPVVLDALEDAGYVMSFDRMQQTTDLAQAAQDNSPLVLADRLPQDQRWSLNSVQSVVTLQGGARLDVGGVAKGWAAEQTLNYLAELGPAMVDAGGDMVFSAAPSGGPWEVEIENPFAPAHDSSLPVLGVEQGAVATSGRDLRKWYHRGQPAHHIIDPRTGLPVITDVLTATVVAPTIFQAEVAAKVAVILGSPEGMRWVSAHHDLGVLLILKDGAVKMNEWMESQLL